MTRYYFSTPTPRLIAVVPPASLLAVLPPPPIFPQAVLLFHPRTPPLPSHPTTVLVALHTYLSIDYSNASAYSFISTFLFFVVVQLR